MVQLFGVCLALGMVAVVFGHVLFLSQEEENDRAIQQFMRILMRRQASDYGVRLGHFSWSNCGQPSDPLDIKTFTLAPDPIKLPGTVTFSVSGAFLDVLASPIKLNVTMKFKVGTSWVTLPCVHNIGTCIYDDICVLLAKLKSCPSEVTKAGFNCTCPFPKKAANIPASPVNIQTGDQVPAGDYQITGDLSRAAGHVGCYQVYVSLVH